MTARNDDPANGLGLSSACRQRGARSPYSHPMHAPAVAKAQRSVRADPPWRVRDVASALTPRNKALRQFKLDGLRRGASVIR
jgi:hypothetical protein